jgi:hypothetical protein
MTPRPVDPESRRSSAYAAVALVLVMVTVLLAAGCVSPGSDNQNQTLTKAKFVVIEHKTNYNISTISGMCHYRYPDYSPDYSFDENNGALSLSGSHFQKQTINGSLLLFYGHSFSGKDHGGNRGEVVYFFPATVSANVTFDSINEDGTVSVHYDNTSIMLKTKEQWKYITRVVESRPAMLQDPPGNNSLDELKKRECIEEFIITDSIYNAGIFDKNKIVIRK